MFAAIHDVRLKRTREGTRLSLAIRITSISPNAGAAIAGTEISWEQLLTKLTRVLTQG